MTVARQAHFALPPALACLTAAAMWPVPAAGQTPYTATWASVNTHTPAPEWFEDAKFGIYFHWGVYSVPAFDSEWYPRNMYDKSGDTDGVYAHHMATYGDPDSNWPYNNFIDGAKDKSGSFVQFAPALTSSGGNWDPDAWAQLFLNAGARYVGPSMEHHDGFSMWDSKANPWNSLDHGPKLNLAQLHVNAFRKAGFKIVAALHTAYHFNGYYQWVPPQTDSQLDHSLRPAEHGGGKQSLAGQAQGGHRRVPARRPLAGLRPQPGRPDPPARISRLLLQRRARMGEGRGGDLQGWPQQSDRRHTTTNGVARPTSLRRIG